MFSHILYSTASAKVLLNLYISKGDYFFNTIELHVQNRLSLTRVSLLAKINKGLFFWQNSNDLLSIFWSFDIKFCFWSVYTCTEPTTRGLSISFLTDVGRRVTAFFIPVSVISHFLLLYNLIHIMN